MTQGSNGTPWPPFIGVDIGQKRDPTAIAVVEMEERERVGTKRKDRHFLVRFLQRLAAGSSYPEIARRLGEICHQVRKQRGCHPEIYVDATGLGQPVVQLFTEQAPDCERVRAVYFTHGDRRTESTEENTVTLGKAFLVARLQTLLQCNCLHLPATPEARALAQELDEYEVRVDENANERYGAFRVGTHDDLVTALGLAVQIDHPWYGELNLRRSDFSGIGPPSLDEILRDSFGSAFG